MGSTSFKFAKFADLPPGPWKEEDDKTQWVDEVTDLDCLIVRNHNGTLCGYVGVPPGHPLHGKNYSDVDDLVNVHGGLTYADFCQEGALGNEGVCHVPEPGRPADVFWFGFDTAHAWDIVPKYLTLFPDSHYKDRDNAYRDMDYVKSEVKSLAAQLATLKSHPRGPDGSGWQHWYSPRCEKMSDHVTCDIQGKPLLPVPCESCYSIENYSRPGPYVPGRAPQLERAPQ